MVKSVSERFGGATRASNGLVIFAPHDDDVVGVFDPVRSVYSTIDISSTIAGDGKFSDVVLANNGLLVFVPSNASSIGI